MSMETINRSICKFNFSRSSDLTCLNFIHENSNAQAKTRPAAHHAVNLVTSGTGTFTCEGRSYSLAPGTLFFVCEHVEFSVESEVDLEYCYISFHGRRANEYLQRLSIGEDHCLFSGYETLIPFWLECHDLCEESNIDIVCEAVLLYSLARLKPQKQERSDTVSKIIALTQEHFTNPDLSLNAIADDLGYDAKYLSALFRKKKGIPYSRYLRELRIRHAVFLIEEGVVSVKNIAILSGFHDALYFSRVFTQAEGMSPKSYILTIAQKKEQ